MGIKTDHQLAATQEKLRGLEEHYRTARSQAAPDDRVAQLSLRSVVRIINQMKEEIVRYKARAAAGGRVRED